MSQALTVYNKLKGIPLGKKIFSRMVCLKAPYLGTIKPLVVGLEPVKCVIRMKKRRGVTNHLGMVHAIAMCNLVEFAGGMGTIDIHLSLKKK